MAFKKDPDATLDYTVDWSDYLTPISDTIASVTWVLAGGLVNVATSHTTTTATIFVSGGTVDVDASITCRIATAAGTPRIDDRTIDLVIVQR